MKSSKFISDKSPASLHFLLIPLKRKTKQCLYWNLYYCFYFYCSSESSGGVGYTSNSFIFSLRNKESLGAFKSWVKLPSNAIFRHSYLGPVFGFEWFDILISDNAKSNQLSFTDFGVSYLVPSVVQDRRTVLAGTYKFSPNDWEVFYLP